MSDNTDGKSSVDANYPGNSRSTPKKEKKNVEKVVTGDVVTRKKSVGRKIKDSFTGEDARSVGQYILFDVMIPAAKAMIADAFSQGAERMLFGDTRTRKTSSGGRVGYTSYNRMYSRDSPDYRSEKRDVSKRGRASHDFDEIVLDSRSEAEEVIDRLVDLVSTYDVATVSDLYDLVGVTGSFTDDKWGWTDLRSANAVRVREGYLLDLPRPQPID